MYKFIMNLAFVILLSTVIGEVRLHQAGVIVPSPHIPQLGKDVCM
jgi:hypothetical protein